MSVFAGRWGPEVFEDSARRLLTQTSVTVYPRGVAQISANKATLYASRTKSATASNPFTTDTLGNGYFFADPGEYDLVCNSVTIPVTVQRDPSDGVYEVELGDYFDRLGGEYGHDTDSLLAVQTAVDDVAAAGGGRVVSAGPLLFKAASSSGTLHDRAFCLRLWSNVTLDFLNKGQGRLKLADDQNDSARLIVATPVNVATTSAVSAGATSIPITTGVSGINYDIPVGAKIFFSASGVTATVTAYFSAGSASISVEALSGGIAQGATGAVPIADCAVRNVTLDCNSEAQTTALASGQGQQHAIYLQGAIRPLVENVRVHHVYGDGIYWAAVSGAPFGCVEPSIRTVWIDTPRRVGIHAQRFEGGNISDLHIYNINNNHGIKAEMDAAVVGALASGLTVNGYECNGNIGSTGFTLSGLSTSARIDTIAADDMVFKNLNRAMDLGRYSDNWSIGTVAIDGCNEGIVCTAYNPADGTGTRKVVNIGKVSMRNMLGTTTNQYGIYIAGAEQVNIGIASLDGANMKRGFGFESVKDLTLGQLQANIDASGGSAFNFNRCQEVTGGVLKGRLSGATSRFMVITDDATYPLGTHSFDNLEATGTVNEFMRVSGVTSGTAGWLRTWRSYAPTATTMFVGLTEAMLAVGYRGPRREAYRTAAPTSGTWSVGDIVYNLTPTAGGTAFWMCTTAGTPGTWKAVALAA